MKKSPLMNVELLTLYKCILKVSENQNNYYIPQETSGSVCNWFLEKILRRLLEKLQSNLQLYQSSLSPSLFLPFFFSIKLGTESDLTLTTGQQFHNNYSRLRMFQVFFKHFLHWSLINSNSHSLKQMLADSKNFRFLLHFAAIKLSDDKPFRALHYEANYSHLKLHCYWFAHLKYTSQ